MKKTTLIITSILFITSIVFPQTKVNKNNLVQYGDKWFKENDDKPFTGIVFDMSKETGNKILESKYVKGLPHGNHIEWYNNGKKKVEGKYKSGMMNGYWEFYFDNGNIKVEGSYSNGNGEKIDNETGIPRNGMDGKWIFYYQNGKKNSEGTYKDGKEDGLWAIWYESGQKKMEAILKDGELISDKCWDEDGNKIDCN